MLASLKKSTPCRLPKRLGFGLLGGLLGAVNPAWIYLVSSPNHIYQARRIQSFDYMLNFFDFAFGFIFSMLIIPAFLSTFILFPWFSTNLAEMGARRKIGFWQLWGIGCRFGLAASLLTAFFILSTCLIYNIAHKHSNLLDLWILLPGTPFIGAIGILLSLPAFLLSALVFAWATLQYQINTNS